MDDVSWHRWCQTNARHPRVKTDEHDSIPLYIRPMPDTRMWEPMNMIRYHYTSDQHQTPACERHIWDDPRGTPWGRWVLLRSPCSQHVKRNGTSGERTVAFNTRVWIIKATDRLTPMMSDQHQTPACENRWTWFDTIRTSTILFKVLIPFCGRCVQHTHFYNTTIIIPVAGVYLHLLSISTRHHTYQSLLLATHFFNAFSLICFFIFSMFLA